MSDYKAPLDAIRFVLFDVFHSEEFWQQQLGLTDLDRATAEAIVEEAAKICEQVLAPLDASADEEGCHWKNGEVTAPQGFKDAYRTFCEGGWGALGGVEELGGMGMPKSLVSVVEECVQGANMAFGLAPMLTAGACLALNAHASESLKQRYLPKMYCGQWAGAMDLTEPHCGTDLGLMRTRAEPQADGSFLLSGTKIFITWGEHDLAENIIHLVLAKTPGAPAGSRGISLFLVPKFLPDAQGELGERNALSCGSIEKKMGIKGSATCVMNFDGARGWLVGEENRGLACMFTMMNYERLVVGIQGMAVAEASYQSARAYALDRIQGRSPLGVQFPEQAADPLIVHPDVRRMLMTMKSLNLAARAFYIYVARWLDLAKFPRDEQVRRAADEMVALLTPIAKSFLTDRAFDACVLGQQVLGGHGYIREWGQEQHLRDVRITQIYEGTNGVQAMDLIGRKTLALGGKPLQTLLQEIDVFIAKDANTVDETYRQAMRETLARVHKITDWLLQNSERDACLAGAVAVDYQDLLGYLCYAYMCLRLMSAATDESEYGVCGAFFFEKLLPQTLVLEARIYSGSKATMIMPAENF